MKLILKYLSLFMVSQGIHNDKNLLLWDIFYYIKDKKVQFECDIDMNNHGIENVNNLSINYELNMNNRQIKNVAIGNEDSDAVIVKQVNDLETELLNKIFESDKNINLLFRNLI